MTLPGPVSKALMSARSDAARWQLAMPPMLSVRIGPMSRNETQSRYCIIGAPVPPRAWSAGRKWLTTGMPVCAAMTPGSPMKMPHA